MGISKTFLAIGISVVFAAFAAYALNVIYPTPEYDYSTNNCYLKYDCYRPVQECESKYYNASGGVPVVLPKEAQECSYNLTQSYEFKQCQKESEKCNEEFQIKSPQYSHARNTFVILLIIGIVSIIAGSRMRAEGVGSGFIGGGVLLFLWSLVNSWMYVYNLDKYFKLAGLGIALAVLIYIANKKFNHENPKDFQAVSKSRSALKRGASTFESEKKESFPGKSKLKRA